MQGSQCWLFISVNSCQAHPSYAKAVNISMSLISTQQALTCLLIDTAGLYRVAATEPELNRLLRTLKLSLQRAVASQLKVIMDVCA